MDADPRPLPIGEAARLAGVTVRALHHDDRSALVVPGARTAAGYRGYERPDLLRLQHVLAYRELGLDLRQIRALMDDPATDPVVVLRRQHDAVLTRMERLRQVAAVLERTMAARSTGIDLTPEAGAALPGRPGRGHLVVGVLTC